MKRITTYVIGLLFPILSAQAQFGPPRVIDDAGASQLQYMEVADFDLDGDDDIALVPNETTVAFYENLGDGTFGERQRVYDQLQDVRSFEIYDINQDGAPDIIVGDRYGQLIWFPNQSGSFPTPITLNTQHTGGQWIIYSIMFSDMDADGMEDIVISIENSVYWLKRLSSNSFADAQEDGRFSQRLESDADSDNDGDKDLFALKTSYTRTLSMYENLGDGEIDYQLISSRSLGHMIEQFINVDLDGDDDLDILFESDYVDNLSSTFLSWFENDGSNNFEEREHIADSIASLSFGTLESYDLDNDGDDDVIYSSYDDSTIYWASNNGSGNFSEPVILHQGIKGVWDMEFSDFNGDEFEDIAAAAYLERRLAVLFNDGTGSFPNDLELTRSNAQHSVCLEDFNGDDINDIIVTETIRNRLVWYEGKGPGTFHPSEILLELNQPIFVILMDISGDLENDLLYAYDHYTDESTYEQTAKLAWRPIVNGVLGDEQFIIEHPDVPAMGYNLIYYYNIKPQADLDADGDLDLFLTPYIDSSALKYLKNDGLGNFSLTEISGPNYLHVVDVGAFGQIDGDGIADLMAYSYTQTPPYTGGISWLKQIGDDEYADPILIVEEEEEWVSSFYFDDMDDDGFLDLMLVMSSETLVWFKNNGNAEFTRHDLGEILTYEEQVIAMADHNDDGVEDIITTAYSNSQILWYENSGNSLDETQLIGYPFYSSYEIILSGDVDNDGDDDLLYTDYEFELGWIPALLAQDQVRGRVFLDSLENCNDDFVESMLEGAIVIAENDQNSYYDMSNYLGEYRLHIPENGDYTLRVEGPNVYLDAACFEDSLVSIEDSVKFTIDFPVRADSYCPLLSVDIAHDLLRRCFDVEFDVHYCNIGTYPTNQAYIEIRIDDFMDLDNPPPFMEMIGLDSSFWRVDVGRLEPGECGTFQFVPTISCDAELGQYHCVTAHAYPDGYCTWPSNPQELWDSSQVSVAASCSEDSVELNITNTGSYDMQQSLSYYMVADESIFEEGEFQLASGESLQTVVKAEDVTYHIKAEQSPGFPGLSNPSAFVEGCAGSFTTSYAASYINDDLDPWTDIACDFNVGSQDPNDKKADLIGYGPQHFIEANTDLNYTIRFQNTGTDTAFTVVIIDTLSEHLDPATMRPGISSHPYEVDLDGSGILVFTFNNILLPDSNVNQDGSNGYVVFDISQFPDQPDGTVIFNDAGIYFDFNDPVITNTVYHTIGRDFIENNLSVAVVSHVSDLQLSAYPNPAVNNVTIALTGETFYDKVVLSVIDRSGRIILNKLLNASGNQIQIDASDWDTGMYLIQINDRQNTMLGTGKIFVWR